MGRYDRHEYFRHLVEAKRIETILDLEGQGYETRAEASIAGTHADLIATKDNKKIVFEFKAVGDSGKENDQRLRDAAKRLGFEFRLVLVKPPRRIDVGIKGFEALFTDYLINDNFPVELYDLASSVILNRVTDVEFSSVEISKDEIEVEGGAIVEVTLEYGGGESRDGVTSYDEYPLTFHIVLDHELEVIESKSIEVDTSSFYE